MRSFGRELRVADHIRERLAEILRAEMRDPRAKAVSINDVRVSRDLSVADVYFSSLDAATPEQRKALEDVLNHAAGFLRTQLARDSNLRTMPKPRFHFDEVWARGAELDALIQRAVASDQAAHAAAEEGHH
jgi:ribosome-binding factor A